LQADLLLFADDALDFAVFERHQIPGGNLAARAPCPRRFEGGGAEQAPDMISTEGRLWASHGFLPAVMAACLWHFADTLISYALLSRSAEAKPPQRF